MVQPRLGASLHSIANPLTAEALSAVAASGIATLEVWPPLFDPAGWDAKTALKEMLARTGIRPMTIHARFGGPYDISVLDTEAHRNAVADTLSAVDLAVEFDAPMVVVHASAEPIGADRPERRAQARRALGEIGRRAAAAGRRIAVELLPRTCLGNTADELLAILDGLPAATFGACLDVNHLMDRYRTLPDVIRRLGDRLITTHLSDYDGVDEKHWLPGAGVIAWPGVLAALDAIGYAGPFNFECRLEHDTPAARVRALEASFAALVGA